MLIGKKQIIGSIGSFISVLLIFGAAFYYVDQQRLAAIEAEKNAHKLKLEAIAALAQAQQIEAQIRLKEAEISESVKAYSRDKELSELTLKFIDEFSDINFLRQCGDNPEHNAKAKKAKALLQLIEAKAKQYGRTDILELFVERQKTGIGGWSAVCKT